MAIAQQQRRMSSHAAPQEQQQQPQQPTTSGQPPAAAPAAAAAAPQNGSGRNSACPPHVLAAIYGKQENKQAAYETSLKRWWTGGGRSQGRGCQAQVTGGCAVHTQHATFLSWTFSIPGLLPLLLLQSTLTARTTKRRSMWLTRCCMTEHTCRAQRQPQTASPGQRRQQGEQWQQQE